MLELNTIQTGKAKNYWLMDSNYKMATEMNQIYYTTHSEAPSHK